MKESKIKVEEVFGFKPSEKLNENMLFWKDVREEDEKGKQ